MGPVIGASSSSLWLQKNIELLFHAALRKSENFIKLINANFVKAHKASKWEGERGGRTESEDTMLVSCLSAHGRE